MSWVEDPCVWTHDRLKPKAWKGEAAQYLQVKYNGHRCTLFKQSKTDGRLLVFGRKIEQHLEMSAHLAVYDWYKRLAAKLDPFSSVDGELYVPNRPNSVVKTALIEGWPELQFMPFAVPWWNAVDMSHESVLDARDSVINCLELPFAQVMSYSGQSEAELIQMARDMGIEGWVLKQHNYSGWWKVKPTETLDAVIMGLKDGDGKYLGAIGAFIVGLYKDGKLTQLGRVSGMDDDMRWELDESCIGRVIEIEYQNIGSKGGLIHARFKQFRDDKPATDCTWEDLPA